MIHIKLKRDKQGQLLQFSFSGHAGYAAHGEDIVCAAVSGIVFGTINSIEALLKVQMPVELDESDGFLHCDVPQDLDKVTQEKVQLLLSSMVVSVQLIENTAEYKPYLKIDELS